MSIKDMFAIAKSYGDPVTNGLNQFKDYLSVENAINKNWQDALTFNNNTAAINAHNALNAFNDQQKKRKAEGELLTLTNTAQHLYDPTTGQYRPDHTAAQMAAGAIHQSDNPYAQAAAAQNFRTTQLAAADQIAAIDPAQALALRNAAWGNLGVSATQDKNGLLSVTNSQGYTRKESSPDLSSWFAIDPNKRTTTGAAWQRDDQVLDKKHLQAMDLQTNQYELSRLNNEHSLNLQNELAKDRFNHEADTKWEYALKEHDWKKANGLYDSKTGGANGNKPAFTMKDYVDTRSSIFNKLLEQGQDWVTAANNAEIAANDMFGLGAKNQAGASSNPIDTLTANIPKTDKAKAATPANATTAPQQLSGSTFAGTRFGSYQIPRPADTREAEINQLSKYLEYMNEKYKNTAIANPNSYLAQQQLDAIKAAQRQLNIAQNQTDLEYHEKRHPLAAAWNKFWYGESNPDYMKYK